MVSLPGNLFDGTANVSFVADGIDSVAGDARATTIFHQTHSVDDTWSSSSSTPVSLAERCTSFNATYYHCTAGSFWSLNDSTEDDSSSNSCELCTTAAEGDVEVMCRRYFVVAICVCAVIGSLSCLNVGYPGVSRRRCTHKFLPFSVEKPRHLVARENITQAKRQVDNVDVMRPR